MGLRLGRYELLVRLCQGGGANVFLARDHHAPTAEAIALKVLLPQLADNKRALRSFLTEGDLTARIEHPNIIGVRGFGEAGGVYALAMEYVFGESLGRVLHKTHLEKTPLSVGSVMFIGEQISWALEHAHSQTQSDGRPMNLVHRDISPENLLIGFDGAVKLTDFGIAKVVDRGWETEAGVVKGKARYLSPEQVLARRLDARSDVFSLGIVLWEALTGRRLFAADTLVDTFKAVRDAKIPPPSTMVPGLHPIVDQIVLKALRRDPKHRYGSAGALARAINALLGGDQNARFGRDRLQRELAAVYGAGLDDRAASLAEAVNGDADVNRLAHLFGAEPIRSDQLPENVVRGTLAVTAARQPTQPVAGLPARTERMRRGDPELDARGYEPEITEEAAIDTIAALMNLEPESLELPRLPTAALDGWHQGHDADEVPLYMRLSTLAAARGLPSGEMQGPPTQPAIEPEDTARPTAPPAAKGAALEARLDTIRVPSRGPATVDDSTLLGAPPDLYPTREAEPPDLYPTREAEPPEDASDREATVSHDREDAPPPDLSAATRQAAMPAGPTQVAPFSMPRGIAFVSAAVLVMFGIVTGLLLARWLRS